LHGTPCRWLLKLRSSLIRTISQSQPPAPFQPLGAMQPRWLRPRQTAAPYQTLCCGSDLKAVGEAVAALRLLQLHWGSGRRAGEASDFLFGLSPYRSRGRSRDTRQRSRGRQQRYGSEQEANTRQLVGAAADAILAAIPAFRFCCIRILSADEPEIFTHHTLGPLVALAIDGACGQLYTSGWFLHCDGRVTLLPGAEKFSVAPLTGSRYILLCYTPKVFFTRDCPVMVKADLVRAGFPIWDSFQEMQYFCSEWRMPCTALPNALTDPAAQLYADACSILHEVACLCNALRQSLVISRASQHACDLRLSEVLSACLEEGISIHTQLDPSMCFTCCRYSCRAVLLEIQPFARWVRHAKTLPTLV
jgi:hypothetical protein